MGLFSWIPFVGDSIDSAVDFVSNPSNIFEWAQNTFNPNKNADKYAKENQQIQNDFNSAEAKLQRDWSADQAQISRDYSTNEREAQQSWQEKMVAQQNEYNSPSQQLKRLVAAGVSPTQLEGVSSSASPSGVPSGASSSIPSGASASGSALSGAHGSVPIDPFLSRAQARLMDAQAKDLNSQTERREKLLPGEVRTQEMNCRVMDSDIRVNDATVQKLGADVRSIDQQIVQSKEYSHLLSLQAQAQQKELDSFEDKFRMICEKHAQDLKESNSRIRLNAESVNELASRARLNLANAQNAEDVHILNGANLRFMAEGGEEFLVSSRWDVEQKKYSMFIKDFTLHHEQFKTGVAQTKHERKLLEDRKTWYGEALDWIGQTVDALGSPFGAGVTYGVSHGSHTSNSNVNVTGESNVTTKRAFDINP